MKKYVVLLLFILCALVRVHAVGWTPTDAGLVVNMEQGDRFLLSVWVDINGDGDEDPGEEFFVNNYNRYTGGYFNYEAGPYLKLIPEAADATEPSDMSIWTVGAPLNRVSGGKNYDLGAVVYTIWNDGKMLRLKDGSNFQFAGDLTDNFNYTNACDVIFVIPTVRGVPNVTRSPGPNPKSFDPDSTLNRGGKPFDGRTGTGFLGMTYREVYMFDIPRLNIPISYTNASLVTFNTTQTTWNLSSGAGAIKKGRSTYAYADKKHDATPRTLFRLYLLDKPFVSCPDSYFFATDEQNYKKYRKTNNIPGSAADSTTGRKVYSMDYLTRMAPGGGTNCVQTGYMNVPAPDSTYYYVGYKNDFKSSQVGQTMGTPGAHSAFKNIRNLPMKDLAGMVAPAGAYGRMVADTTSIVENHAVAFEPAGYFFKISTGANVRMRQINDSTWITQDMWTITEEWAALKIRATLMTGPSFSETDPGADVAGWSVDTVGTKVPVLGGGPIIGMSGYARITTNRTEPNGNLIFIPANLKRKLSYNNNTFLGEVIPDQYPTGEDIFVTVQAPRLKAGYIFDGWTRDAAGTGKKYDYTKGDTINLVEGTTTLYAQAHYTGTLQIALSFKNPADGNKRYFITHPNSSTPRYARARHFENWDNTWQGMENAENLDPNYISTFELRHPSDEVKAYDEEHIPVADRHLFDNEKVLDPRQYTMRGYEDSLTFYEFFHPAKDEYLGLYYNSPNTIVANNTWAGLFVSTVGWPTYTMPYVDSTKLYSRRYVLEEDPENHPDSLTLKRRSNYEVPYVKYNTAANQFDGVAAEGDATDFQLSAITVADAHYIVLPDTTHAWNDTITFDYHTNTQTTEDVWSALIGKQLMAVMVVDGDTIFFHPNRNKIINDPNDLYLSSDFRVTQIFEFKPDTRVKGVADEDRVTHATTDHYWHHTITSGMNTPINVKDASGNYTDIFDTLCIHLSHGSISKIKGYRGRWKKGAPGLDVSADGMERHRDIIIRTKTYHYADTTTKYILTPTQKNYVFNPFANQEQQIDFKLNKVTTCLLKDVANHTVRTDTVSIEDVTTSLRTAHTTCSCPRRHFSVVEAGTFNQHVTVKTVAQNSTVGDNLDTLVISGLMVEIDEVNYPIETARVPLTQTSLIANDLVWSVMHNGQRYFIMAVSDGSTTSLQFRQFTKSGNMLYKLSTKTQIEIGSNAGNNTDGKYLTPWDFAYVEGQHNQLMFSTNNTKYSINKKLAISDNDAVLTDGAPSAFTYHYVNVFINENANEEELVRLQYDATRWLKFDGTKLTLGTEAEADTFSWGYLEEEYNLMNNGTYPSHERVSFGYNATPTVSINTKYKAYREYSMLLGNQLTYLAHVEATDTLALTNETWKTAIRVDTIRDRRTSMSSGLTYGSKPDRYMVTKVTPSSTSPMEVKDAGGNYIDIVDTLRVRLSLKEGAPRYRFKGDWSKYSSISDANLKIPIVRTAYHEGTFDTLACKIADAELDHVFPATITPGTNDTIQFKISTLRRVGTKLLDAAGNEIAVTSTTTSYVTKITTEVPAYNVGLHLNNKDMAEVRLMDEYGNTPSWCKIKAKGDSTITVQCLSNGVRSPRSAYLYLAYIQFIGGEMKFVNYRLTVSQLSLFDYANNQQLVHSKGASGDDYMANGMQQVHENHRILYYYPEQDVELPVRERNFYGWWRWFREGKDVKGVDVSDSDIPDSVWRVAPHNIGKYNYPFRTIGDSVKVPNTATPELGDSIKVLSTMGRYTVFHYKAKDYGNEGSKKDPPAKNPRVAPPITEFGLATKPTLTYAVDISNYYDKLPMSPKYKNQVDTACLDTMQRIPEPTLSLREVFELRPWTEMANTMDKYKSLRTTNDAGAYPENEKYMEDHVIMAPTGNRLLLSTEQRYNFGNLMKHNLSESLLGYYMHDDNWYDPTWDAERKDTMIWCGGWDADCLWYTYDPTTRTYTPCTYNITSGDDFLDVPAKSNIDTVYYCLRARSMKSTFSGSGSDATVTNEVPGDSMFNICRYKVIYHSPRRYGPLAETTRKGVTKALLSNDEIEQKYDVLERLNFDYNKPGRAYVVYPHPLPWADASYGYTYPETSDLPHNRRHDETDFPNHGEYGLINRIPYTAFWRTMEQHGGAENGYMIYCDGMSSSGQVAALSLSSTLCAGQKMFLSAYVGNPSSQTGKSNPNFIFTVQGKMDGLGAQWEDITTYMTGDIMPSDQWNQILFPINHIRTADQEYHHFRIRIYNVSSDFDGNDFVIDDICVFATKQPLIAYQASTACKEEGESKETHVILRIDYQGIIESSDVKPEDSYNNNSVYYTVLGENRTRTTADSVRFVPMEDGYLEEDRSHTGGGTKPDTIFGKVFIPAKDYNPDSEDSVYTNMQALLDRFEDTYQAHKEHEADHSKPDVEIVREGYIYEVLEGESRPVKYLVHIANMNPSDTFTVHLSAKYNEMMSSMCGMTSRLKVSNRMVLELNGMEKPHTEVTGLCVNATYDVSLRVKGSLYLDSVAPIDLNGSCINDWLLYGDTAEASSKARYNYYYSDIKKVITEVLRVDPGTGTNKNQFAPNLSSINKNVLRYYAQGKTFKQAGIDPYNMLDSLVNNGFLTLYKSKITTTVTAGDSAKYVIFPIVGTGTDALNKANVEVCPVPVVVTLKPDESDAGVPLMIGGLHRDSNQMKEPVEVLATELMANEGLKIRVDSIMANIGIKNIVLQSTNDPGFREGIDRLSLVPDRIHRVVDQKDYYHKGDSMVLTPAAGSYQMQQGYSYLFHIVMQDEVGRDTLDGGCAVGRIPFVLSVQPDYLRWDPQSADSRSWNNPDNWIGITQLNAPIHVDARFAPMEGTYVVIPQLADTLPYPVVPPMPTLWKDSVQKVNFEYNNCNIIRFMPGAAMGQQQRMAYTDAVVDMSLPNQQWAFRAAPVKGMLSGDIFMSNADLNWETSPWEVGSFDAAGRTYRTGNGSFWLSVHSRTTYHYVEEYAGTETRSADGNWSKVTNGLDLYLPPAAGFAVYARTASNKDAVVRLPKSDDKYYYYGAYGETLYDRYVSGLVSERNEHAGGSGAGKLAFHADSEGYTIDNTVSGQYFVFGNPTMGYIDIWGFIADNTGLEAEIGYLDESGDASIYIPITKAAAALTTTNKLSEQKRYLPPMHAIMLKTSAAATSLSVTLNANRIVTDTVYHAAPAPASAPKKRSDEVILPQGIMTVTATNPASPRCTSHLLLGQGYHDEIRSGEDAMLTTLNIDNFTTTSTPTTPFNLYALEGNNAMSIDLKDSIVNIPVSFYMSDLEFEPTTYLWFTGVNKIHGELVFYDAQTDTERAIIDGICIAIETPTQNHERRYYIRRRGYKEHSGTEIATDVEIIEPADDEQVVKFIKNDQVYILRRGQVYTILGQPVR